jgi:hypothetical protein
MTTALDRGRTADLRGVLDTPGEGEEVLTAFDRWLTSLAEQKPGPKGSSPSGGSDRPGGPARMTGRPYGFLLRD